MKTALTLLVTAGVGSYAGDVLSLSGVPTGALKSLPSLGTTFNPRPIVQAGDPTAIDADAPDLRVDPNVSSSLFAGVGSIFTDPDPRDPQGFLGTGTPISPRHILTAAHIFDPDNNGIVDVLPQNTTFFLNNHGDLSYSLPVASITLHPDYTGFMNPTVNDDLAILTLASPLPSDVPIYPLLPDGHLAMQQLLLVGYGVSGDGLDGYYIPGSLSTKRTGANLLEAAGGDDEGSGNIEIFAYDFEDADNLLGTDVFGVPYSYGNNFETLTGPGDSGGPAFAMLDGELYLAGVNTYGYDPNTGGSPDGKFGDVGGGAWAPTYASWINQQLNTSVGVPEAASTLALLAGAATLIVGLRRR